MPLNSASDLALRRYSDGRLLGLRTNRYSWWTHWRELADYILPRRYKWLITPNQQNRGSPINQHILDSTGTIAARDLAAGLMSGKSSPTRPWLKLKIGRLDSTQTSPVSLWLKECERLMYLVFSESNFYTSMAQFYYDLVVFGTAWLLIYEDFDDVICCYNPCAGECYSDIDGRYRPTVFYREFTMTVAAAVDEFGIDNFSDSVKKLYEDKTGSGRTREIIIAHGIEPNDDGKAGEFGVAKRWAYREVYWEWGGSTGPQQGTGHGLLRKKGYHEQPNITVRWDIVSNDPYGRSPAMDALPDIKQLQLEQRRKAQAIDKMVNPPLVADIQLKNQPASVLPGGITYVTGYAASGKPGFSSAYDTKFPVQDIVADITTVWKRIQDTFFTPLFKTASQFETRSNVTAMEWDMRKSESMIMLGPVIERLDNEGLKIIVERVFAVMSRAGILPPAPQEIHGMSINIEFISMLAKAQDAAEATGIERLFGILGNVSGIDPAATDNVDIDYGLDKYSALMNNDPKLIRTPDALQRIRKAREAQQQQQQRAEQAEKMAKSAKVLSETPTGAGQNALQQMLGGPQ